MDGRQLWYLARMRLFADLDAASLARLEGISPLAALPRGTPILGGDPAPQALYLLKRGRVRLFRVSPDGRPVTLALLTAGNVFGSLPSFPLGSPDMQAEAMDEVLICKMQRSDMERLMREHPAVGLRLIEALSRRVRELEDTVASLAHDDVRHRVVRVLLHLCEDFGRQDGALVRIDVPITHDDLAAMVGSTRETVTATLSRLSREDVVRTGRRSIRVRREAAERVLAMR